MFIVLALPQSRQTLALDPPDRPAGQAVRVSGDVDSEKVAVFQRLQGFRITCTAGRLWLTVENDPTDYVLGTGERLVVPSMGKVIVGGRGSYRI
jgi:hypothetical protein